MRLSETDKRFRDKPSMEEQSSLVLPVCDWKLQVDITEGDVRVCIITDDKPTSYRYIRISLSQAEELRDFLNRKLKATD